mmetsp:Transcript_31368/g.68343  ORF Transcript_31368/g.68343 Transcript_31368/m.68343 type:complete len:232 (-) Transcript_31368:932-1627(-)
MDLTEEHVVEEGAFFVEDVVLGDAFLAGLLLLGEVGGKVAELALGVAEVDEGVVVTPVERVHLGGVALVGGELADVEVLPDTLDFDVVFVGDGDQVAAIREFGAGHLLEGLLPDHFDALGLQHLELDLGRKADHDLEPVGVVAQVDGFLLEGLELLQLEVLVVLDAQTHISRESGHILLAHTHVDALDFVRMEGLDHLLEVGFALLSRELVQVQADQLPVARQHGQLVLLG